jgi:hypothetical protein
MILHPMAREKNSGIPYAKSGAVFRVREVTDKIRGCYTTNGDRIGLLFINSDELSCVIAATPKAVQDYLDNKIRPLPH